MQFDFPLSLCQKGLTERDGLAALEGVAREVA